MKKQLIAVGLATVFTLAVAGPVRADGWHGRGHASHDSHFGILGLALGIPAAIIGTALLADALIPPPYAEPAPAYDAPPEYYAPPTYYGPPAYYPPPVYYGPRVSYAPPVYYAPRAYYGAYGAPRSYYGGHYRPAYRPSPNFYRGGQHAGWREGRGYQPYARGYQPTARGDHRPSRYASAPAYRHAR